MRSSAQYEARSGFYGVFTIKNETLEKSGKPGLIEGEEGEQKEGQARQSRGCCAMIEIPSRALNALLGFMCFQPQESALSRF